MQLRKYLGILWRRFGVILLVVALTVGIVLGGSQVMSPVYSATATVRMTQIQSAQTDYYASLMYTKRIMDTYTYLLKSWPFVQEAIREAGLQERGVSAGELVEHIEVESPSNTELLQITVEHADPQIARDAANALANLMVAKGYEVYAGPGESAQDIIWKELLTLRKVLREDRDRLRVLVAEVEGDSGLTATPGAVATPAAESASAIDELQLSIRLREELYDRLVQDYYETGMREQMLAHSLAIADPAGLPPRPDKPQPVLYAMLAALVGLVGGVALALVFENLDTRIHSLDTLREAASLPVLGVIPSVAATWAWRRKPILLRTEGNSAGSARAQEAFGTLRSTVFAATQARSRRPVTLQVSSAEAKAGRSTVLLNLATALAQARQQVILVDGDWRHPSLHQVFGLTNQTGLSDVIAYPSSAERAIQETSIPGIRVVTTGQLPEHPATLLRSPNLREAIRMLADNADVVLLDSPPILGFSDAVDLASLGHAVLLVVARSRTTQEQVEAALLEMEKVGATVLGTVFNRARPGQLDGR